jgi:hypothetical protein
MFERFDVLNSYFVFLFLFLFLFRVSTLVQDIISISSSSEEDIIVISDNSSESSTSEEEDQLLSMDNDDEVVVPIVSVIDASELCYNPNSGWQAYYRRK